MLATDAGDGCCRSLLVSDVGDRCWCQMLAIVVGDRCWCQMLAMIVSLKDGEEKIQYCQYLKVSHMFLYGHNPSFT